MRLNKQKGCQLQTDLNRYFHISIPLQINIYILRVQFKQNTHQYTLMCIIEYCSKCCIRCRRKNTGSQSTPSDNSNRSIQSRQELNPNFPINSRPMIPQKAGGILKEINNPNIQIQFRQYRLLKSLGRGQFGQVFLAESIRTLESFAIKRIRIESQQKREKILEEARILSELNHHNNIIKIKQFFEDTENHVILIVTEYCAYSDLQKYIGRIQDPGRVKLVMLQVAEAVQYLHMKNIIHRDIKPVNILLDSWFTPKLADMGFARYIHPTDIRELLSLKGTPIYHAPEKLTQNYGKPSDIWSLGIVFIELLLGTTMFKLTERRLPTEVPGFPTPAFLERIRDDKIRDMVRLMLLRDDKKRITIDKVVSALKKANGIEIVNESRCNIM